MPKPTRRPITRSIAIAALTALMALMLTATAMATEYRAVGNFECSATTPCGSDTSWEPERLAVSESTGDVFVIDKENGAVQAFDSKGKWLSQITGFNFAGTESNGIAVDNSAGANRGHLYVAAHKTGSITAIDPSKGNAELWTVADKIGTQVAAVAVDPAGNPWYADFNSGLEKLNPATGAEEGTPILASTQAGAFDFNSAGEAVIMTQSGETARYNVQTEAMEKSLESHALGDISVDRLDGSVFMLRGSSKLWVKDEEGNLLAVVTEALTGSSSVTVNGGTKRVYVSDPGASPKVVHMFSFAPILTLPVNVTGEGKVESDPAGILCETGETCKAPFDEDETVTLTGTAKAGYVLAGWLGGCKPVSGHPTECEVKVGPASEVTAVFLKEGTQGVQGDPGQNGSNGTNGSNGAAGPQGPAGVPGALGPVGPVGPAGPAGPQGPAGKVKVTCKVSGKKVKCVVKQAGGKAKASSLGRHAGWRLVHGGRTVRHGVLSHGGVRLGGLRPGHYRLLVAGVTGGRLIVVH